MKRKIGLALAAGAAVSLAGCTANEVIDNTDEVWLPRLESAQASAASARQLAQTVRDEVRGIREALAQNDAQLDGIEAALEDARGVEDDALVAHAEELRRELQRERGRIVAALQKAEDAIGEADAWVEDREENLEEIRTGFETAKEEALRVAEEHRDSWGSGLGAVGAGIQAAAPVLGPTFGPIAFALGGLLGIGGTGAVAVRERSKRKKVQTVAKGAVEVAEERQSSLQSIIDAIQHARENGGETAWKGGFGHEVKMAMPPRVRAEVRAIKNADPTADQRAKIDAALSAL